MYASNLNGHGQPQRQPQPVLALQLILLDNGQTMIQPHPEQPINTPERIGQAARACGQAHLHFLNHPYPPPEGAIEIAPNVPVARNPRA